MRRWVTAAILTAAASALIGLLLTAVVRQRARADRLGCFQRFERLGQFAAVYAQPPRGMPAEMIPQAVPPGTVPNPDLPPDRRLSWIVEAVPLPDLAAKIDRSAAWDADPNREAGAVRLALVTCPGTLPDPLPHPPPGGWMPTQFVGLAGVGPDGATLPVGSPRAGCFRYDAPTPLRAIRDGDGLSNTALFAETADELGPWIRGGSATVRHLDVAAGAKKPIGAGGQFGGNYKGDGGSGEAAGFGLADGSARWITARVNPDVLRSLFTIAGQGFDPPVGE